ncbi:MAG TPA: RecX family transcriptional regulator, partial [Gaiellaceae bacterium]|nr:RecX family transcriptional regulator [Gaiellaceae bacterium]
MTPTVTALRVRKRGRVAVDLDGEVWRVLPADAVVRAGLALGRRLDRPAARELARELRRAKALAAATRSLAASDQSQRALEQRLTRAGHSAAAREDALAALDRAGLLDDARLAQGRAELLARRGYGDAAIRADLRRRLVAPEAAASAVAALEPERERLRRVLDGESVTPAALRRLSARGFSSDTLDEIGSSFA